MDSNNFDFAPTARQSASDPSSPRALQRRSLRDYARRLDNWHGTWQTQERRQEIRRQEIRRQEILRQEIREQLESTRSRIEATRLTMSAIEDGGAVSGLERAHLVRNQGPVNNDEGSEETLDSLELTQYLSNANGEGDRDGGWLSTSDFRSSTQSSIRQEAQVGYGSGLGFGRAFGELRRPGETIMFDDFVVPEGLEDPREAQIDNVAESASADDRLFNEFVHTELSPRNPSPVRSLCGVHVIRRPVDTDDVCAICWEELEGRPLSWCKSQCGKNFHRSCIHEWIDSHQDTCPNCRGSWEPLCEHDDRN